MRKLLMIAAFAAFTACASQSDTDVGETTPQTDETTTDQGTTTDETTTTPPADETTTPPADETTPPSTGYEPQPGATDTLDTPPGDTAMTERSIPDTSTTSDTGTWGDTSSTGTWGDTSSTTVPPSTGVETPPSTTDEMPTTAPDSL